MKVLIIIISIISTFSVIGQQVELNHINKSNLRGVFNTGDEAFAMLFLENRSIDRKDIYQISFLNSEQEKIALVVDEKSRLIEVSTEKGETYFVFNNPRVGNFEIFHLDKNRRLNAIIGPDAGENTDAGIVMDVEKNQAGNIFIFRSYSVYQLDAKNVKQTIEWGTEILSFDKNLNQVGAYKMKFNRKTRPRITGFTEIEEGFVLNVETRDLKTKKYELALHIFNHELVEIGHYNLAGEEGTYFPSEIISDNGQLVLAGYNLKGSIFDSKKAEGLFVTVLNMDGVVKNISKYSWDLLKGKLAENDRADFIFSGKMNVLVEKIIPSESGYQIICESFANNSGTTVAEVALGEGNGNRMIVVYDFVLFETTVDGSLVSVNILQKDPMNIEIGAARMSKASRIEFAYFMKKHKAFPFRNVNGNTISFVNYKNKVGYLSSMDITTGTSTQGDAIVIEPKIKVEVNKAGEEFIASSKTLTKLDNLDKKVNKTTGKLDALGSKLEYGIEKVDVVFNPGANQNTGIFTFNDGRTISFFVHPERYSIFFDEIK